ncbi:MAG: hypothetical protein WCJ35_28235, partial [Planctomycetota bacterium]
MGANPPIFLVFCSKPYEAIWRGFSFALLQVVSSVSTQGRGCFANRLAVVGLSGRGFLAGRVKPSPIWRVVAAWCLFPVVRNHADNLAGAKGCFALRYRFGGLFRFGDGFAVVDYFNLNEVGAIDLDFFLAHILLRIGVFFLVCYGDGRGLVRFFNNSQSRIFPCVLLALHQIGYCAMTSLQSQILDF